MPMATDLRNIAKAVWGFFAHPTSPGSPALTGAAAQTMLSWAKHIESYDTVPEVYKGFFNTLLRDSQVFPFVALTPSFNGFSHKTTEKLVCDVNDTIYVLERSGSRITTKGYPLGAIRDIEVGVVLLDSWITISGVTSDGVSTTSTFEFNTTSGRHFASLLNKIRPAANGSEETELSAELAKFDYLASSSFKFMNYARSSLVCGEKVIHTVWQPEIRARTVALPGWPFYRTLSMSHLIILTDKELILIREDERVSGNWGFRKRVRYGGIWQYIPLDSIVSVSLAKQANDLWALSIYLSEDGRLDRVFTASSKHEVAQLQDEIEKLSR